MRAMKNKVSYLRYLRKAYAAHIKAGGKTFEGRVPLLTSKFRTEYNLYKAAQRRCRPNSADAKYYAARGIEFRFVSFEQWLVELGIRPTAKHTVDRENNNGHYEPGNVRWATRFVNIHNRRIHLGQYPTNELAAELRKRGVIVDGY